MKERDHLALCAYPMGFPVLQFCALLGHNSCNCCPGVCGLLVYRDQQTKEESFLLGITGPNQEEEIRAAQHNEGREEYVWNADDPLGHVMILNYKWTSSITQP